jgi:hypothetical protein
LLQILSSSVVTAKLVLPVACSTRYVEDKLLTYTAQRLTRLVLRSPHRLRARPYHRRSRPHQAHQHRSRKLRQLDPSHDTPPHRLRRSLRCLALIHRRRRGRISLRRASRTRSLGALPHRDGYRLQLVRNSTSPCQSRSVWKSGGVWPGDVVSLCGIYLALLRHDHCYSHLLQCEEGEEEGCGWAEGGESGTAEEEVWSLLMWTDGA